MSQEICEIWNRFDALIAKAESPDTKTLIEAIKLQSELLNTRLAPLGELLGAIARKQ